MSVAREARRFSGGVYDLGLHVVWCSKYRRPVLSGRVAQRLEELIRSKADERGWQVIAVDLSAFPTRVKAQNRTRKHRAAQARVNGFHAKVRRQRVDHHHKAALDLIRSFDAIAHERLNIAGMTKKSAPRPDPERQGAFLPNGAAAKAGLDKSIHEAGWGVFLGILARKAESAGRGLVPVDPRNTSRCPRVPCGHTGADNRPTQEKLRCVRCGYTEHADRAGAVDVGIRAGLVLPVA
ncbi:zinc ribbon domain-containing protein [Nocardiopsis sp. CNT312]|uniref:zinc ribbon domain-containing protein n=1 Tax=Nocardiopsis sp. CNT312 TaxID=1137268 RepID=UPI0012DD4742|nr:zinc ribbon domain-containing protein [Nocardiopsis sp. CNT312]